MVTFEYVTEYCPELYNENIYPLLLEAIDSADAFVALTCQPHQLRKTFTTEESVARFFTCAHPASAIRKPLKEALLQRLPLRTFFEIYYREIESTYRIPFDMR